MAAACGRALNVVGEWLHLKTPRFFDMDEMIVSLISESHERWLDRTDRDDRLLRSFGDTLETHATTALVLDTLRTVCRDCRSLPARSALFLDPLVDVLRKHQARWHSTFYDPGELVVDFMDVFYDVTDHHAFHTCWRGEGWPAEHCPHRFGVGRCERVASCPSCYPVNVSIPSALMMVHQAVAAMRHAVVTEDRGIIDRAYRGLRLLGVFFDRDCLYARQRVTCHFSPARRRYAETLQSLATSVHLLGKRIAADFGALKDLDMEVYLVYRGMLLTP